MAGSDHSAEADALEHTDKQGSDGDVRKQPPAVEEADDLYDDIGLDPKRTDEDKSEEGVDADLHPSGPRDSGGPAANDRQHSEEKERVERKGSDRNREKYAEHRSRDRNGSSDDAGKRSRGSRDEHNRHRGDEKDDERRRERDRSPRDRDRDRERSHRDDDRHRRRDRQRSSRDADSHDRRPDRDDRHRDGASRDSRSRHDRDSSRRRDRTGSYDDRDRGRDRRHDDRDRRRGDRDDERDRRGRDRDDSRDRRRGDRDDDRDRRGRDQDDSRDRHRDDRGGDQDRRRDGGDRDRDDFRHRSHDREREEERRGYVGGYVPRRRSGREREPEIPKFVDPFAHLRAKNAADGLKVTSMSEARAKLAEQQMSARQMVLQQQATSAAAAASKTQREVYVGNLMQGKVTEVALRQLFDETLSQAYPHLCNGRKPCMQVSMHSEGRYAFVELASSELATAALALSGQLNFLGSQMTVGRPSGYIDPSKAAAAAAAATKALQEFSTEGGGGDGVLHKGEAPKLVPEPTKCVVIDNMVQEDIFTDEMEFQELKEDLQEECTSLGEVEDIRIPRPDHLSSFGTGCWGKAYVCMATEDQAVAIRDKLHGRHYDGKMLDVAFVHPAHFYQLPF